MSNLIFPTDFDEKTTIAQDDYILFSDSEDSDRIKKAKYSHLKWETWTAATIAVWSTSTWAAWSSASVTNSWTSSAAVFDFTIPKWDKWDTGNTWPTWPSIVSWAFVSNDLVFTKDDWNTVTISDAKTDLKWDTWNTWAAATIAVGTVTTWAAWSSATITNTGTSSAAVFDFSIPQWDKWDTWATWNWIASITSSKVWKTTTVTITETWWTVDTFTVEDWADGTWTWDVIWPNSSTDWNMVLFDGATWKLIKDSLLPVSYFIIKESDVTVSTDATKWVSPYNTSYWYTNIDISGSTWIKRIEWAIYTFDIDTTMVVTSTYRNVRVKIWTWAYIPVMWTTSILAWHSYFTKANIRQYQYSTKYQSWWALHLFTDSNTTYSSMTTTEIDTWTWTSARTITPANLKYAIQKRDTNVVSDTAYDSSWDWVTWVAPSKNAVYDKFETLWTASTKNTWTSSWNVPVLDSNWKLDKSTLPWVALTDTFTVSTSSDLTWLSSAEQWDLAIVTTESKTYVLATEPYSTAANWKEILSPTWWVTSVNSKTWAVTLDADDISDSTTTNKFVTATEKSTWNWKQNALATQTAYTSKWTSTKVATITTNTLWQVTAVTETSIDFPVTSVNGSTWAVTWLQSQHTATTATLSSASWSSHTQTVSVTWVTASNTVLVSPAPSSFADYTNAMIYCSAQASGTLTFTCTTDPSSNITVNVVILG